MICLVVIAMMQTVLDMAQEEVDRGGLPFATIIVNAQGEIIARAVNTVADSHDPTDHAEIRALRIATQKLQSSDLSGHEVYAIGYPCPMCLAALKLAKPKKVYFALALKDKNKFMKQAKYALPMEQVRDKQEKALDIFKLWSDSQSKALSCTTKHVCHKRTRPASLLVRSDADF